MDLIGCIVVFFLMGMGLLVLLGAAMHAIFSLAELFVLLENVFAFLYKRCAPFRVLVNVLGFILTLIVGFVLAILRIVATPVLITIKMARRVLEGDTTAGPLR